jgi:hypothetical protein
MELVRHKRAALRDSAATAKERGASMRQATAKQTVTRSTAGTTTKRTRKSGADSSPRQVRRTRRPAWLRSASGIEGLPPITVDLDLVHRFQAAQAAAERLPTDALFLETLGTQYLSLEALEWLAQYRTLGQILGSPASNVTHMAPALEMNAAALERLARDACAEAEAPAAAPAGPAVA